ncbi:MFS transporter [Microbacterium sediminicola]|uniref:MFS transporter n=1 Tax=Microbacterium sediminicola TaxID=415210 RepID=A0ABP4UNJ7_9MICO
MTSVTTDASPVLGRGRLVAIVFVLVLIEGAGIFEQTMVLGGLPFFAKTFDVDLAAISWIVTVFTLVGAGSAVLAGRLGDIFGRKQVLIVILLASLVGSLLAVFFPTYPMLLVGRALQGLSAGIMPLLIGIAREVLPPKRIPSTVALLTATATLTAGIGVMVGAVLIDAGNWHDIFIVAAVICAVSIILGATVIPKSLHRAADRRVDWLGAVLLAPALAIILFGFTMMRSAGPFSPLVLGSIGVGVVLLIVWIVWELKIPAPLVNLRALAQPRLRGVMMSVFIAGLAPLAGAALYGVILATTPADMPVGLGLTPTMFGIISLGGTVVTFALTPIAGVLAAKFGGASAAATGAALFMVIFLVFLTPAGHSYAPVAIAAIIASSVANAFLVSGFYNMVVERIPAEATSEFVSVQQVVRNMAIAIGTVIISLILSSSTIDGTTAPTVDAWNSMAIYCLVVTAIVFVFLIVALVRGKRATAAVEAAGTSDDAMVTQP